SREVLFREEQRLADTGWIFLVYAGALAAWGSLAARVLLGGAGKARQPLWLAWLLALVYGVLFPVFFRGVRLTVEVDGDGVVYRYFPFHRRPHRIPFSRVISVRSVTYHPIQDFGGWGIRFGLGRRKAYTVSGREGVELELQDGWRVLLGSRRPGQLLSALEAAMEEKGISAP
ncbi:MAG: DUF6141 family protein, partial [Candidatus Geothermincolales bacterium]